MASCAACLRPISQGEKFALAGTEVFHRVCVRSIQQSIGTRQKLELVELRTQLGRLQHLMEAKARVADEREQRLVRERDRLTVDVISGGANLREAERLRDARDIALREAAEAKRDAAAARSELALLQALNGSRTSAPVASSPDVREPATPVATDLDDAEQRFRLLELDPLE